MTSRQTNLFSTNALPFWLLMFTISYFNSYISKNNISPHGITAPAMCSLTIKKVVVGDCEFGPRTGNQSKLIVAVFLTWTNPPPGSRIEVKVNGQSKFFDPFEKACPPYVQFILDPDGSNQMVDAEFTTGNCASTPVLISLPFPCDPPICAGSQALGGKVYQDYNNNGIQESSENGIPGIDVKLYDDSKTIIASTTSKTNGLWSINGLPPGLKVRVEYQVPPGLFDSNPGPDNKTRTQKTTIGICNANLGIFFRQDVIEVNPWIVTAMFSKGDGSNPSSPAYFQPTIVANLFNTPNGGPRLGPNGNYFLASNSETGSIWGLGFQKETRHLFSAAFLKRNAAIGPFGLGAIYDTDLNGFLPTPTVQPGFTYFGNTKLLLNLDSFGIQTGDENLLMRSLPFNMVDGNHDSLVFDLVGKWGLGDLDLNEAGDTLYVINMYNQSIITIALGNPLVLPITPDRINETVIPNPACKSTSDWRPWALKHKDGKLYIGGVCSAESTGLDSDLRAVIYTFENTQFKELINFELHYQKGFLEGNLCGTFRPWSFDFYNYYKGGDVACGPVPVLSDIEFDSEDNLIVALGDRFGYQTGGRDFGTRKSDRVAYIAFSGGDNLKLFKLKDEYLLEQNGTAGFYTTRGANNNQGICKGEYYFEDGFFSHQESAQGALAIHPSYNTILSTMMDPAQIWSNGWSQIDNSLGTKNLNYNIFTGEKGTFGKSSGLGDIEILNGSSTPQGIGISIGNYVWKDFDADGLQDPGEEPVINLTLKLFDLNGNLISQTQTDTNGLYIFKSLAPLTKYFIQLGSDSLFSNQQILIDSIPYAITKLHNRLNFGNGENDSDASLSFPFPTLLYNQIVFEYTTGNDGENDFSIDFGLVNCVQSKIDSISYSICPNDSIKIGEVWFSKNSSSSNVVLQNAGKFGCDSSVFIQIHFLQETIGQLDTAICLGESMILHNQTFDENNTNGLILLKGENQNGCDSILSVKLSFLSATGSIIDTSICTGEQIILHQQVFDENNTTGIITLANSNQFGCDSIIQVKINVLANSLFTFDTTICSGDKLLLHQKTFDETNPTDEILLSGLNQNGCDSILKVQLHFFPKTSSTLDTFICSDSEIRIHNQIFDKNKTSGTILLTSSNQNGCDSSVQINLHFFEKSETRLDTTTCPGQQILIHGELFDQNRLHDTLVLSTSNYHGCDSTLLINLKILPEYYFVDTIRECGEFFWPVNGTVYQKSGSYQFYLNTKEGCDSIHSLVLEILPEYIFYDTLCTIDKYYWSTNGLEYDKTGFYEAHLSSKDNCDSIRYLVLEIIGSGEVYIPNVFSPNGDGVNDKLSVFSNPDIAKIDRFSIFDRWGELMYEIKNFLPNDPNLGWDGVFRSTLVQPAVFAYLVEWTDKLGGHHKAYGDITLIR
ncbi:MAG: gliding motility-associated C-terminal domain-containing protein [Saprospiraceae bacterium]|nr:gliding motility-associated C-terminal domain-containing protein [Saprospiraceae bacterium]MBK9630037.1 gliding motility-associated C-terminal domain-containing protein [Saprospiraceae bacterium]